MSKTKQTKNIDAMLSDDSSEEVVQTKKGAKAIQPVQTKGKPAAKGKKDSDDESSSSDIEILKNKTKRPEEAKKAATKAPVKKPAVPSDSDSEEEVKPVKKVAATKAAATNGKKKQESSDDESSEEVVTKKPAAKVAAKVVAKKQESSDDESSEEVKAPVKKAAVKAKPVDSDEDSDEEEVKTTAKPVARAEPVSDCMELFCKNLSWNTDENVLSEFFGKYGEITAIKVLYDKMTGKARGLAFVAFSSREEAQAALDDAANLNIDGRLIQVSFSDQKPPQNNNGGSFGNNRGGAGGYQDRSQGGYQGGRSNYGGEKHTVFVGNLGFKTNENNVRKFFEDCGSVVDVRIAKNEEGRSKGFCHVDFETPDAVEKAKSKAGQDLDGRELRVDASTPRQGGGDRGGRGGRGGFGGGRGGGRGGFGGGRGGNFNSMDRAKKTGAMIPSQNAVVTFNDDD